MDDSTEENFQVLTSRSIDDVSADSLNQQFFDGSPAASSTTRSTSVESEEVSSNSQLHMSSTGPISRTQTLTSFPTCQCLEEHSKLLYHLKSLEQQQHITPTLDAILIAVQHSLETWHKLIHCRICPYFDDQTVLHLAVMTMKSMLGRFQRFCVPNGAKHSPSDFSSSTLGMVRLDSYEATKNERVLVIDLLIVRALGKIRYALLSLKEKFDHFGGQKADACLDDEHRQALAYPQIDVENLDELLQNLDGTVQAIRDAARKKDHVSSEDFGDGLEI